MKRFVVALTVLAMGMAGLMTAVVLPAGSANAAVPTVGRLHGADRYATSAAIVHSKYQPGVPVVYIATGVNFPDALAGGAAAAKAGGPLLVVLPGSIPPKIAAELTRLTPASIVVLGGQGAVSNGVMTSLKTYTSGPVTRVAGTDRYATAAKLAAAFPVGSPVFIATGRDFPDALAGSAAAAAKHAAILLTGPSALPSATMTALSKLAPSSITILGGTGVVSAGVATQLGTYSSRVTRLWGADRYATAAAIANSVFPGATGVFIATGAGFADALTGGPVAGSAAMPLLLSTLNCLPAPTAAVIAADAPATVTLLGGMGVLGAGVEALTSCETGTGTAPVTPPGSVRNVTATPASTSVVLSWTNPTEASLTGVMIRRAAGATAPASATAGTLVTDAAKPATSFTDTGLTAGTQYSYALFAHDGTPVYATSATVTVTTTVVVVTPPNPATPPGPVTTVSATPASTSVVLSWTNPTEASLTGVMIRRAAGPTAPASATTGTLVTDAAKPATSFTDTGLTAGTQYSYALFAHDSTPVNATAATVTVTTTGVVLPSISGMVTDAGGTHQSLAGVVVHVSDYSLQSFGTATTDADGNWSLSGLPAGTEYEVCFTTAGATGGSMDATGYVAQCYDNTPTFGTLTFVTVTSGSTRTGVDAALAAGGAVSGTVTDPGIAPQALARVRALGTPQGLAGVGVQVSSTSTGADGYATTTADGSYTVTGLPPGTDYTVCFDASLATGGSSDATGYVGGCYDNEPTSRTATPVTVTSGATTTGVDAALAIGGAVSGTVTDAGGAHQGLANVRVHASPPAGDDGFAMTAADGSYTVTGLPPGTDYTVCFDASLASGGSTLGYVDECYNDQPTSGTPTPVAVTSGANMAGVDAALAVGGAVSGTVTDAGGALHGLAGVDVQVYSTSTQANGQATTAPDGSYTVIGLPSSTDYTVCFAAFAAKGGSSDATGYLDQCWQDQPRSGTPTTPVTVASGATTTAIDAALAEAGAISGMVTEAAGNQHGLAGVLVSITGYSLANKVDMLSTTTEADGSWSMPRLKAGPYLVCFTASGATGGATDATGYVAQCYANQPISFSSSTPVSVTSGATTPGINAALAVGGAISGTVTDAGGTHHGLAGVEVVVYSNGSWTLGVSQMSPPTAADGSYTVTGLPAGTQYTVCFGASGATGGASDSWGYTDKCWQNQPTSGTLTAVAVTVGQTSTGIDAALVAAGTISGTVTDAGGTQHGLANVWVYATSTSTGANKSFLTAADGSYDMTGLPAGTDYQLCFYPYDRATGGSTDALGYASQCWDNQPTSDTSTPTPVTVRSGANTTGNAALVTAGAISGTVTDAGGTNQALEGVQVNVQSTSTGAYGHAVTAADGGYNVIGLPAGTDYQVCFQSFGATGGSSDALGYVNECWDNQPTSITSTPVEVTLNATRSGINAALLGR